MARERARRSTGKLSAITAWEGATPPASPTPTPIRAANSWPKLVAQPHAAVNALQTPSDRVITQVRLVRSAIQASGIAIVE